MKDEHIYTENTWGRKVKEKLESLKSSILTFSKSTADSLRKNVKKAKLPDVAKKHKKESTKTKKGKVSKPLPTMPRPSRETLLDIMLLLLFLGIIFLITLGVSISIGRL